MSDEKKDQDKQEFKVEGTVEAVKHDERKPEDQGAPINDDLVGKDEDGKPTDKEWAPDQVPARDKDPERKPDDPEANFETPKDAQDNSNENQPAAESHFNENPPEPGRESESTIAHDIANQAPFPSHEPAKAQSANAAWGALPAQPVKVDGRNRRSDDDALEGYFVDVVSGYRQGSFGSFERVLKYGKDGYPTQILVRTRDEDNELISVAYRDVRPAKRGGGR